MNIYGENANDQFGYSVSLSSNGSILAIGAPFVKNNNIVSGNVMIYEWKDSNWMKLGNNFIFENTYEDFGTSVSLSSDGTVLAIGSQNGKDNNNNYRGHVKVYEWNGSIWNQRGTNIIGSNDYLDYSVSLSGDGTVLAIGSPLNDNKDTNSGLVIVYKWENLKWVQLGIDIYSENAGDRSGYSVSLSNDGNVLAIGAIDAIDAKDSNNVNGHVRVYDYK